LSPVHAGDWIAGPVSNRSLRVLALPAFRKAQANPALALLAEHVCGQGVVVVDWTPWRALGARVDLWHLHFPDIVVNCRNFVKAMAGTAVFAATLVLARWRGVRVLWTVHDMGSHDRFNPRLEDLFWRFLARRVDGYVCLDAAAQPMIVERFPGLASRPCFVSDLGGFDEAYPSPPTRADARQALDIPDDAVVLLHFGLIRRYKNVPDLLSAVRALADPRVVLVIAGRPFEPELERRLRDMAAQTPGTRLLLRWIPPDEVSCLFAACDLVVLPYQRTHNSGVARLAMTMRRPVLLPDIGLMRVQQTRFGADWVQLYRDDLNSAVLARGIHWATSTVRPHSPSTAGLDWESRAVETCAIYRALLSRGTPVCANAEADQLAAGVGRPRP
jgi:glycosyltransferase involved in cell wall biosynthesis